MVPESPSDYSNAFAFIEGLDRLSSPDEVMDAMQRALARFGLDFFSFFTLPRQSESFKEVTVAVRMPPEWLKVYLEEQYVHVSPAVRHCRRTVHPFEWKSAPYDREREPRAAELADLMADFGFSNGIMVPIPGATGCEGCAWSGGRRLELKGRDLPMIHFMSLYAFERIRSTAGRIPRLKPKLTLREREVLTWVALGKSAWEIGEILGIAKRTVDEHAQTAMHKLGAVNRAQAVALALRDRSIEP